MSISEEDEEAIENEHIRGRRRGDRGEKERAEIGGAEVNGASDLLALDFWVLRKAIEGSSRFQQFFLI